MGDIPWGTTFAGRGALGLIVLATDETPETLAAPALPRTVALLPAAGLRAIGYGRTSGATVIGPERVAGLKPAATAPGRSMWLP